MKKQYIIYFVIIIAGYFLYQQFFVDNREDKNHLIKKMFKAL